MAICAIIYKLWFWFEIIIFFYILWFSIILFFILFFFTNMHKNIFWFTIFGKYKYKCIFFYIFLQIQEQIYLGWQKKANMNTNIWPSICLYKYEYKSSSNSDLMKIKKKKIANHKYKGTQETTSNRIGSGWI